jgi:glycosyltransferase involved in cell wall biosynthesis
MQLGHAAVLLCTYNGARFIEQQLRSLANQTLLSWSLHVSDDGSTDDTIDRIQAFAASHSGVRVTFRTGPRADRKSEASQLDPRHPATVNFLTLVSDRSIAADYFAYCDQDDVWHPNKLERAIKWLSGVDRDRPALYCSRTRLMDEGGVQTGLSPLFAREPGFRNALVQSIAGGNTMVMNRAARDLIAAAACTDVVAHDWWTYLLVSGADGVVNYDARPTIDYRQHPANLVGSNQDLIATFNRLRMVYAGGFKIWMDCNLSALERCKHLLSPSNRQLVEALRSARTSALLTRLATITRLKLYRQTRRGQLALYLAAFLAKL